MRFEPGDPSVPTGAREVLSESIQPTNDPLRVAVEALASLTDAPLRMDLVARTGRQQIFEAREEFECGDAGRGFVVSVDQRTDRVVVISAGRPV